MKNSLNNMMNLKMKWFLLFCISPFLTFSHTPINSYSDSSILPYLDTNPLPWLEDFSEAKKEAKESGKMILLNFCGTDWCAPCIQLRKKVFASEPFQEFAKDKLVLLRADFPRLKKNQLPEDQKMKNEKLAELYNKNGVFPLTVLIDQDGNVLKEWEGYQPDIQKFLKEISDKL
ncbi:MAG: hypothetical protein RIR51_926 [Bacteroidota bacterium]